MFTSATRQKEKSKHFNAQLTRQLMLQFILEDKVKAFVR